MDGRWSTCLALGLLSIGVGCKGTHRIPGLESSQASAVIAPAQTGSPSPYAAVPQPPTTRKWGVTAMFDRDKKPTNQMKPETLVIMANLRLDAAEQPGRSPQDRDQLLNIARESFQQALAIDPNHLDSLKGLARFYAVCNDGAQAQAMYRRALVAHPKNATLRHELGMSYARQRDFSTAVALIGEAVQIDPDNRVYRKALGFSLVRAGKIDEGCQWLVRCMPEVEARYNVAQMLFQMGRDDDARRELTLALQINPTFVPASEMMAQLNGPAFPPPVQQETRQVQYSEPQVVDELPILQPIPTNSQLTIRHGTPSQPRANANTPAPVMMSNYEEPLPSKVEPLLPATSVPTKSKSMIRGITPLR